MSRPYVADATISLIKLLWMADAAHFIVFIRPVTPSIADLLDWKPQTSPLNPAHARAAHLAVRGTQRASRSS